MKVCFNINVSGPETIKAEQKSRKYNRTDDENLKHTPKEQDVDYKCFKKNNVLNYPL